MALMIKNVMEDIVEKEMKPVLEQTGCCTCDKCRSDIAAYVLNQISPRYVVSEKGALFSKAVQFEPGFSTNLTILLSEAVTRVQKNPHHSK